MKYSPYAYENFCEMYEAYHALGGNSMVTKCMMKYGTCI